MISENQKVIKRDGTEVLYDDAKVRRAVARAVKAVDGEVSEEAQEVIEKIVEEVNREMSKKDTMQVETIQDIIEKKLMQSKRKDVAKAFILYRNERNKVRERNSRLVKNVIEKIEAKNVQNQNANVDEASFGGRIGEASDAVMKEMALNYILSPMARDNHLSNEIYIHDLSAYAVGMHNCLSIPFDKLLAEGFDTRQVDIRPAQSVNTAFQLVAVIFQLQSLQQFGGVSATHLDWTMIPYVRKSFYKAFKKGCKYLLTSIDYASWLLSLDKERLDKDHTEISIEDDIYKTYPQVYRYAMDMLVEEIQQSVEGMYHNLNSLQSRSGCQLLSY